MPISYILKDHIYLTTFDINRFCNIWQENYINYRPSSAGKDDSGMKRMSLLARAAESIGDGDIINVQIRRYRQWQLSQTSSLASSIIPYVSRVQCYQIIAQVFFLLIGGFAFLAFSVLLCCTGKGRHFSR